MSDWTIIGMGLYAVGAIVTWGNVEVRTSDDEDVTADVQAVASFLTRSVVSALWPVFWVIAIRKAWMQGSGE